MGPQGLEVKMDLKVPKVNWVLRVKLVWLVFLERRENWGFLVYLDIQDDRDPRALMGFQVHRELLERKERKVLQDKQEVQAREVQMVSGEPEG